MQLKCSVLQYSIYMHAQTVDYIIPVLELELPVGAKQAQPSPAVGKVSSAKRISKH